MYGLAPNARMQKKRLIREMVDEGDNLSFMFTGYIAENAESRKRTIIGSVALLLSEDMGKRFARVRNWYFRPFAASKDSKAVK